MSKEDKLHTLLNNNGIAEFYTSEGFDVTAEYPSGRILIPGTANDALLSAIYNLYATCDSLEDGQLLFVTMWPTDTDIFKRIRNICKEVHYVDL